MARRDHSCPRLATHAIFDSPRCAANIPRLPLVIPYVRHHTGAACELPCRGRGASHDGRDLVKGHVEQVVQHERNPLGGSQPARSTFERTRSFWRAIMDGMVGYTRVLGVKVLPGGVIAPSPSVFAGKTCARRAKSDRTARAPGATNGDTLGTMPVHLRRIAYWASRLEHSLWNYRLVCGIIPKVLRSWIFVNHPSGGAA